MENPILISTLNDFVFCPISIYFKEQYFGVEKKLYQVDKQQNGTIAHQAIDEKFYSTSKNVLQAKDVYCDKYGLVGKIDLFYKDEGLLVERKKHISKIYDGYVFQLYAQYFAMTEMGYKVKKMKLYSYDDNKSYFVDLPEKQPAFLEKFETLIAKMKSFDPFSYVPNNKEKCAKCIYYEACDRGL